MEELVSGLAKNPQGCFHRGTETDFRRLIQLGSGGGITWGLQERISARAAFQTPGSKSDAGASEHLSGRKSSQTALTPQKTRTAEKCSKATARERKKIGKRLEERENFLNRARDLEAVR